MAETLAVSIEPDEIVPAGRAIEVTSRQPLDARSAQGAIRLAGERALVSLSKNGRTATVRAGDGGDLAPGPHVLLIDEPLSAGGEKLAGRIRIPFVVTDSRAEVPANLRVESMVRLATADLGTSRLAVDRRADGPYIEVLKAVDKKTGKPVDLAFDHDGGRVDAREVLAGIARKQREVYGRMHPELHDRITRNPAEPVTVAVWLPVGSPAEVADKPAKRPAAKPPVAEGRQDEENRRACAAMVELLRSEFGAEVADPDPDAPMLIATLQGERALALGRRDDVAAVLPHETDAILDLTDSIAVANSNDVHALGFDGTGVNVAVWEDGPDQVNLLPIVATFDPGFNGTSQHARHTHGIVANTEANKPHGHAPDCNLHSANRNGIDALRWAARDRGCTVISQSFHRDSEPRSSTLQGDDVYKDWLALRWPYPTIVQAAGNYWSTDPDNINPPADEYVNHKTFNCLTVGNHDDTASAMSGDSVFRNPSSTHGDRELPEIAANGTAVTCVGLTKSGTSMAAPAAAGCVALLQEANATLRSWPEGCRAIAMAGASRNPAGGTWWNDVSGGVDASDGAGAIDALESLRITQSRRSRNAAGTRRGWDVGTLRTSDIGDRRETTFSYNLTVPRLAFGARAKVALAWDSVVSTFDIFGIEIPLTSTLTVDLDLKVYDSGGRQVGYSGSFDNSYEIAEFPVAPGGQYTIKIRRWSGTDSVWYGIAWTISDGFVIGSLTERAFDLSAIRRAGG